MATNNEMTVYALNIKLKSVRLTGLIVESPTYIAVRRTQVSRQHTVPLLVATLHQALNRWLESRSIRRSV
jgi:hypothetical protein